MPRRTPIINVQAKSRIKWLSKRVSMLNSLVNYLCFGHFRDVMKYVAEDRDCHVEEVTNNINDFEKDCSWRTKLMAFRDEMKEDLGEVAVDIPKSDCQRSDKLKRKLIPILGNITRRKKKLGENP